MSIEDIPKYLQENYEIHEWKHAITILKGDFADEWKDIVDVLTEFTLKKSWINVAGGRKSLVADWLDTQLTNKGWEEKAFDTKVTVDEKVMESPTHKVDCFKNRIALEIEWNNKDPFFDRDLNNFRLLFDLRAISVGVIITRCDELQEVFESLDRGSSYGASTTHLSKLLPRVQGGGGGGCPILVFGIKKSLYREDE
jgi:hypothetical protein